jgi:[ribosomal protein S5]-alanine N-acetyltransferase
MLNTNFHPFPVLETERLKLVQMSGEHSARLFEMRSDDEVMRYIPRPRPTMMSEVHDFIAINNQLIASGEGINWAICLKEENMLVGNVGFWRFKPEDRRIELGYSLLRSYWGRGIAIEAIRAVLQYGFEVMNAHSVEADVDPRNTASVKVLERSGLVFEGCLRESCFWEGEFSDTAVYSMLSHEWKRMNNTP